MPGSRRDRPPLLGAIGSSIARTSPTAHGGTVREDYRADGDAWRYFPFDDASSRAYRRSEDGLAGLCDREQRLCFALSFWNGRDPMLKERYLRSERAGGQSRRGRQGILVVCRRDADPLLAVLALPLPTSRISLCGPAAGERQPYRDKPEFGLLDTGDRYWQITADYAKAAPDDVLIRITAQRRTRASRAPCPADALVPQPMVLGDAFPSL
jgi:hypothetical protein